MKTFLTIFLATLCAATGYGQTMKALSYNASNGVVSAPSITFTSQVSILGVTVAPDGMLQYDGNDVLELSSSTFLSGVQFSQPAATRSNLGLPLAALTNTNVTNFRTAIGLGATNDVMFNSIILTGNITVGPTSVTFGQTPFGGIAIGGQGNPEIVTVVQGGMSLNLSNQGYGFGTNNPQGAGLTRTNLNLGATNIVTFAGLTNNGDITINSTTASNGLLFIRRTNNEPFLGLANLLASNNTTISNETLFRVGTAEATNRSAQFGFRSTNTNGSGVAVVRVFGYNGLMMVGADASTNAVIFSGGGTNNEVMTLIRDGATEFARPIRFSTNASTRPATNAPANTTNVAAWVEMRVGTNSYRVPLYQ